MPLHLHNTLTGRQELFQPLQPGQVRFYTCGPTVYDYAHIGNFRSFLAADVLRRWLESPLCQRVDPDGNVDGELMDGGYRVTHIMNITDVGHMVDDHALDGEGEDKMEAARKRLLNQKQSGTLPDDAPGEFDPDNPLAIAEYFAHAFIDDALLMGIRVVKEAQERPELLPRPTNMVRPMLEMVMTLIDKGHAYIASDGVAYFDTKSFPTYGRLSGNTMEKIRSGAGGRVSQSAQRVKKHPADFMLWKPDATHLMRWDPSNVLGRKVSLGEGYPGWHLECSVMAQELLGNVIDIHSGGEDNIFPHHECEIAQSCSAHDEEYFARYWLHTRFLIVEGKKMSKSARNFFTVRDLVQKGFDPAVIRLELIKTHYRTNANFTEQGLKDSGRMVERWRRFVEQGATGSGDGSNSDAARKQSRTAFSASLDDDLNVAGAIGAINTWINRVSQPTVEDAKLMGLFDDVLGVLHRSGVECVDREGGPHGEEDRGIDDLVKRRQQARNDKNFAEADRLRAELDAMNIEVTDTPEGSTWSRKVGL